MQLLLQWISSKYYIFWESVAIGIVFAMRMHHIVIFGLPALWYFPRLSHKWHSFQKIVIEHKMCVWIFSTTFVWNIFYSKKKWIRCDKKICIGLHVKYPLFLPDFNETWILLTRFKKILRYQISWKSVQWEPSCSMRMDGQMNIHDEANSRFLQFCKFV
jgi:hypothetical protein